MTRDQEYFFFYVRNIVFRGQMVGKDNSMITIQFISLIHAELVLEMFLGEYNDNTLTQAKLGLKKFGRLVASQCGDSLVVDGWYVMAFLMEYYDIEKKYRYIWIQR